VEQNPTITVKRACELTETDRMAWSALRASNMATYSPYFHLDYTLLLSELRDDVFIACVYENDLPIAFLPYQGQRFARPVGAPMTDYHGFICKEGASFDTVEILKAASIGAYHFSASINAQMSPHFQSEDDGVVMNITEGAMAWREARNGSYRRHLKSNRRRIREANEDIGEPRFVWNSQDQTKFDQLIAWKKQKSAEMEKYNVLSA